jgi:peptidoglycan/LPS O-acetylase OafA/YrhL
MAALLVFGLHTRNLGYFNGEIRHFADWGFRAGATGVSFFFLLSGFVLAWSARPGDRPTAFWRRRFARVYPVHLVTAVIALFVMGVGRPFGVAANLLLVHSWWHRWWQTLDPVSWSLACEAFFYATFPVLALLLRRAGARTATALAGASVLAVLILTRADLHLGIGKTLYSLPAARLPEFVLGVAIARIVLLGRWRGPGLEASVALTVIGYFLVSQVSGEYASVACTLVGFACLIPAAALADLRGAPSLWRHPILVRLGELSFAFYMIHLLVLRAGKQLATPSPTGALMAFAVSLALSWLLYRYVEEPARRWIMRPVMRSRKHAQV